MSIKKTSFSIVCLALLLCSLALLPSTLHAAYTISVGSSLIPTGLGAGDSFQLAFVTSTKTSREDTPGSGSDTHTISFWNAYVNTVADGSSLADVPNITWFAAASTIGTAANVNAAVSSDVYRLDGVLVDTAASFWYDTGASGTGGDIQNPINIDENGVSRSVRTWGGGPNYRQNGTIGHALGNGTGLATTGGSGKTGDAFLTSWWSDADGNFRAGPAIEAHFYAISEVITVVPEPSAMIMVCLGLAGFALRRKR